MNSRIFFLVLMTLIGLAVFGSAENTTKQVTSKRGAELSPSTQQNTLATQTATMGVVSVEVTPQLEELNNNPSFEVVMNNHSIDLNYEFTQIAYLTDEKGNQYKPTEWTGNTSGHHVRGSLIFPSIQKKPRQLILTLAGVDNETKEFSWQL